MSPAFDITPAEIDAAELFLVDLLASGQPVKLTGAMRSASRAGVRWRAVIAARRRAGIAATRDSEGEWIWTLHSDAAARRAAA